MATGENPEALGDLDTRNPDDRFTVQQQWQRLPMLFRNLPVDQKRLQLLFDGETERLKAITGPPASDGEDRIVRSFGKSEHLPGPLLVRETVTVLQAANPDGRARLSDPDRFAAGDRTLERNPLFRQRCDSKYEKFCFPSRLQSIAETEDDSRGKLVGQVRKPRGTYAPSAGAQPLDLAQQHQATILLVTGKLREPDCRTVSGTCPAIIE
jgi:hypothetical protein